METILYRRGCEIHATFDDEGEWVASLSVRVRQLHLRRRIELNPIFKGPFCCAHVALTD